MPDRSPTSQSHLPTPISYLRLYRSQGVVEEGVPHGV